MGFFQPLKENKCVIYSTQINVNWVRILYPQVEKRCILIFNKEELLVAMLEILKNSCPSCKSDVTFKVLILQIHTKVN